MEKTQREFLLRQQLDAIRKELGDDGDGRRGRASTARRIAEGDAARRRCAKRPSARSTGSSARASRAPSTAWIRTWLDTMLELPWGERSEEHLDVHRRRAASSTPTTPASTT